MNFNQLRKIIKNIKTKLTCASCKCDYTNEDIYVLSSVNDKCVMMVTCPECGTPMIVTASVNAKGVITATEDGEVMENIPAEHANEIISSDDVLEVHSFLKDFDGDFSKLMSQQKAK